MQGLIVCGCNWNNVQCEKLCNNRCVSAVKLENQGGENGQECIWQRNPLQHLFLVLFSSSERSLCSGFEKNWTRTETFVIFNMIWYLVAMCML